MTKQAEFPIYFMESGGKHPVRTTTGASGYDVSVLDYKHVEGFYIECDTGVRLDLNSPTRTALAVARSSLTKKHLVIGNGVGIIDSDYRGTVKFRFRVQYTLKQQALIALRSKFPILKRFTEIKLTKEQYYNRGDRCGQLIFLEGILTTILPDSISNMHSTTRGEGGFGSTGVGEIK